ncbi:hypothetical protein ACFYNF_33355 [Streptomyces sp. NPDC006641]|uniref:hypothetical protein n=1 Tax=unclassified Streptomyces TaxID=2593676 RepID=UPI0036B4D247
MALLIVFDRLDLTVNGFLRPLTVAALTAVSVLSLTGTTQAAPLIVQSAGSQDDGGPSSGIPQSGASTAFDKTDMSFEESGMKGSYEQTKQW